MAGGVFVLRDDRTLVEMQPGSFASESDFQVLLADFPALLAGDQIDTAVPRRWLLVKREKSIAAEEGGAGRWSVDHLFLDQDGIPTLVEVKRQTDTRIRREVVGQMLDYAANSVVYWSVEEIRAAVVSRFGGSEEEAAAAVLQLVGMDGDTEVFWHVVKTNLQAGRIRLLFVADVIPPELRKIVEFLNRQMDPAEVLALELRQFEGEGMRTVVPMVYGQTQEAQQKRAAGGGKRHWDANAIYEELELNAGPKVVAVARTLESWMRKNADQVDFGKGAKIGSVSTTFTSKGQNFYPFQFWTDGNFAVNFIWCMRPPFDDALRSEWLRRLNEVDGINLPSNSITRRPSLKLSILENESRVSGLLAAMDWFVTQLRGSPETLS